ncbi:hypothetical protein ACS0TY_007184 [Phlomoides rotata]
MAEAAVTFLLEEVKEVLKWYKDLITGAENEFQQLNNDLSLLKAYLKDAAKKTNKEEVFRELERQIREVVYDAEDTIENCLAKAAAGKEKNVVRRKLDSNRVSLAKQVRSFREDKLKPTLEKVKSFATMDGPSTSVEESWTKQKKDQSIRQDKVVGFEDEEETLINYLMEPKKELDVISIIGMPGLGKTTLAWKICQNEQICFKFPTRIWVHVSQRFNSREVFLNILKKFTSNDMSNTSDQDLSQAVRSCLEKEIFLLVMDDVWNVEDWKVIQNVLPISNGNGKVLITSREKNVGIHANVMREPHMLRFLRHDESWELLQLEVFGNLEDCPEELQGVGEHIADQCDGVPLTIVVIGGILVDQRTRRRAISLVKKEWNEVSENVGLFLQNDKEKRILDVVGLSYNTLPDYLREGFVYMGVFPEEHAIPSWILTRLWISEGFVQHEEGKSLEESADENLDDLISRNLLMVDKINPIGEIKTCRVHDMIRAFCRSKALEQNLFQEIKKSKDGTLEPPVTEVPTFHRLCFHSDLTKFLSQRPKGPRVRSFLCFYKEPVELDPKYISAIPEAFNLLRVLDSKSIKFHQFPARVTNLIHLRYVTLYVDVLTILPKQISQLWNLQTLVVETKSRSIEMKANIWKMYRLRHLNTKAAIVLDKEWDGEAGENLQTLSRLSPESCTVNMSKRARNLKTLGIRGKLATLFNTMALQELSRLEKLKLMNDIQYESASEDRLVRLPQPSNFPPNLKRLTLSNTSLDWKNMSTLAKIDTLEVLKLKNNAFTGILWNADGDIFHSLQFLLIVNADLVLWEASTNNFPSLRSLVLKNCEKLQQIPGGLGKNLEILDIERLRKSAVDSARKIESEKKVQEKQKSKWGVRFKLHIGPGCEQSPN